MSEPLALLNVYEVETEHGPKSYLCFLDPVLAGAKGIEARSVVGEYVAREEEGFDPEAFQINPAFVEAVAGYMNEEAGGSGAIADQARAVTSGWLYIIDPRDRSPGDSEPSPTDVLGAFAVDESGQVVPGSFQYNARHTMFDRTHGTSGLLFDRAFYDWLHGL